MKMRKRRKVIICKVRYNNLFSWRVARVQKALVLASQKMSKALRDVYLKGPE